MDSLNYKLLKKEVLIELRGDLNQFDLSQKLSYSFNQVGKWEANSKILKWTDFFEICQIVGAPIEKAMRDIFLFLGNDMKDSVQLLETLRVFNSFQNLEEMAQNLNCHVSVLRRWFSGVTSPDIETIFKLMNVRKNLLLDFLKQIININKIPSLFEKSSFSVDKQKANWPSGDSPLFDFNLVPQALLVSLCLGLETYLKSEKHQDQFICEKTNLTLKEVQRALSFLLEEGHIKWKDGKYIGKLELTSKYSDKCFIAKMRRFWTEKSFQRFNTIDGIPPNLHQRPNLQSFFVTAVSKKGAESIAKCMRQCFEEIYQIVQSDQLPEEEIRIVLMDSFGPDDVPEKEREFLNYDADFLKPVLTPKMFDHPNSMSGDT